MELTNMDNVKSFIGGIGGSAVSFLGLSLEDADHIVGIICGVVGLIITIISTVIVPLLRRIKKAKEDGKITFDEVTDIIENTTEDIKKVNDNIKDAAPKGARCQENNTTNADIDNRTNKQYNYYIEVRECFLSAPCFYLERKYK